MKILKLEDMPKMWPVFHACPKYRMMILEDHLLFYIVDEDNRTVNLHRILYAKMDTAQHLMDL